MDSSSETRISAASPKRSIICHLLREYYKQGWFSGSGGGISVRDGETIYIAPTGVHKELVQEDDLFEIDINENVLAAPKNPKSRCSECTPLFIQAYKLRNAGAVLHSHSLSALMVTKVFGTEFQCIEFEMIKGIMDHRNVEWCRVPIIENTESEINLTESLKNAIITYPRSHAVLVRNHGVYVWGPTWEKAKIHAEVYEYLFKAVLKCRKYEIELPRTIASDPSIRAWIIDEEKLRTEDIRNTLQHKDPQWVSGKELDEIGVLRWKLDGERENEELEKICVQRSYKNRDEKKITATELPNYDETLKTFATEHLHADEEIRYVLSGSGYFDVRNKKDQWVRIHVTKGDLIILPEGIYHRYVQDISNFIHVMRLFQDEPKWIANNRPCDEHPSRSKYTSAYY